LDGIPYWNPIFNKQWQKKLSNYKTIMLSFLLGKLYGLILEKMITSWLESCDKIDKGQDGSWSYHWTLKHLITLNIIDEDCWNNKVNLFCCYFIKYFDKIPKNNIGRSYKVLESSWLRVIVIRFYKRVIFKFENNEDLSLEINYNIEVKQGPLCTTIFYICINKLKWQWLLLFCLTLVLIY